MDKVSGFWALLDALGNKPDEKRTRSTATYSGTDSDGTPWVTFPGSSEPTPVRGSVTSDLSMGDEVEVEVSNGRVSIVGNNTDPSLGTKAVARAIAPALEKAEQTERIAREATEGVVAAQTAVKAATDAATQAAANAQAAIEASDQHFFSDSNGVHVSTEEDAPTGTRNILINSLGVILRKASTILAQFTEGEVAFYDGAGNNASNVVAVFGADGIRLGKGSSTHMGIEGDELKLMCSNGAPAIQMKVDESDASLCHLSFTGDGTTTMFTAQEPYTLSGEHVISSAVTTVDGEIDDNAFVQYQHGQSGITVSGVYFTTAPSDGVEIDVYVSIETKAALTIGSRRASSATGDNSLIVGFDSEASGYSSAVVGLMSRATGQASFAQGVSARATAQSSAGIAGGSSFAHHTLAAGQGVQASSANQTALGKYNVADESDEYALIIGNGTSSSTSDRSNALTVDWDGNVSCGAVNGMGAQETDSQSSVSVGDSANADVASVSLPAGIWMVCGKVQFGNSSTGRRAVKLSTTSQENTNVVSTVSANAVSGATTQMSTSRLFKLANAATVYLVAWQNSGGSLTCAGDIEATRLG